MSRMADAIFNEPDASRCRHALLRHEWKIASAGLGAILRRPLDLLTVLIALPVALLVTRAWTASQPEQLINLQAVAVGFAVAFYCVKALLGRCTYHRTDGILAADAQRLSERLAFALPLFGAAAALGFAYLVIVDAHRPMLWLAGTMLGSMAGFAWAQIARMVFERQSIFLRWLRPRQLRRPRAYTIFVVLGGLLGAAIAVAPFRMPVIMIATAATSLTVGLVLGRIDAATVHYRTMVGHYSWAIVRSHISPLLAFFVPFAAALTLARQWAPPAVAIVLGLAVAVFVALRVLAYQSFHQRIADLFVTGLVAVVAVVGLALPPAAPLVMLFGIVWLARRAASRKWVIA